MPARTHMYETTVTWTGNTGAGTASVRDYSRAHEISIDGKPTIPGSSDPSFRGDPSRYNPEEMLVASLSTCHMLWYLSECARTGVIVEGYVDKAEGEMAEDASGGGRFSRVVLKPHVILAPGSDVDAAERAHHVAHEMCFIANSINFPVETQPMFDIG